MRLDGRRRHHELGADLGVAQPARDQGQHLHLARRPGPCAVTGDAATKAKSAAVKSVGSGIAGEVTTDFTGEGYEVTVTKSDGSKVEVHLDKSFNVQQGPGAAGGHGPFGG